MNTPALLATLVGLLLFPVASAHVTVTATAPAAPLPYGEPTTIPVTLSVLCPVVVAEYAQKPELQLALVNGSAPVPTFLGHSGDKVPMTLEQCGPSGNAVTSGNVLVTPSLLAPAFQTIPIKVGAVGETNEGGELNVTVAYHARLAADLPAAVAAGQAFEITFQLTANADTVLTFGAEEAGGHAGAALPAAVDVPSPLLAGSPTRNVTVQVPASNGSSPHAHGAGDALSFRVIPKAKADGTLGAPFEFTIPLNSTTADHSNETHHDHDEEAKESPAPALMPLLLAVTAVAAILRRRA